MTTVSKARSLGLVTGAYSIAIAVAAAWLTWGPRTGQLWLDTLLADVLATLVVFVFSRQDVVGRVPRFVPRPPRKAKA